MNRLTVFTNPSTDIVDRVRTLLKLSISSGYDSNSFNEEFFEDYFQVRFDGLDNKDIHAKLRGLLHPLKTDFIIQEPQLPLKLFCFDMDSTTLTIETMDEFAGAELGDEIKREIERITLLGMEGKLDYVESFTKRHSLLKGLAISRLEAFYQSNIKDKRFSHGIKSLLQHIKSIGGTSVLLSGGFIQFASLVGRDLGFDHVFASDPEVVDGKFTGFIEEDLIFTAAKKRANLLKLQQKLGLDKSQVFACGDGSNDLEMFAAAGLAIAYKAKNIVKQKTSNWLEFGSFDLITKITN